MYGQISHKSTSRGEEIARVNSIGVTKSINLLEFCKVLVSVMIKGDIPCNVKATNSTGLGLPRQPTAPACMVLPRPPTVQAWFCL